MIDNGQRNTNEPPSELRESTDEADDPLLVALAAAEWDDEPYTDEQRALAEAGSEEIRRSESVTFKEVKARLAI